MGHAARDVVTRFLASDGTDADVMATFIAAEPEFQWFSTRERTAVEVAAEADGDTTRVSSR